MAYLFAIAGLSVHYPALERGKLIPVLAAAHLSVSLIVDSVRLCTTAALASVVAGQAGADTGVASWLGMNNFIGLYQVVAPVSAVAGDGYALVVGLRGGYGRYFVGRPMSIRQQNFNVVIVGGGAGLRAAL